MEKDLISVIVPVYNVEKYLEKCVNSIINQTYKNLEIILVDDGATDNSGKMCDEFAKKDSRIKVIHKENGGSADARNSGLDKVTGKYILFVDSDDCLNKKMIEILHNEIIKESRDIVLCEYEKVNENDIEFEKEIETYKILNHTKESIFELYYGMGHKHEKVVVPWGKLYKKELFDGIRYPKGRKGEDELTLYKVFYKANNIVEINAKLYYYLQREGSLSSDWYIKPRHYMVDALEEEIKFFVNKKEERYQVLVVKRLLRELKHNYNFKLKSTKKYGDIFIKYYEKYKNQIMENKKLEEFYIKLKNEI